MTKKIWLMLGAAMVLAMTAALAAACGGGDDDSSSGGGGSDAEYVAGMCKAQLDFMTGFKALTADDAPNRAKADTVIGNLATAIGKLKAPADAKAYQNQIATFLIDARKAVKDGGLAALGPLNPPEPSAAVSARLDALGAKDKNCTDAGFTFVNN